MMNLTIIVLAFLFSWAGVTAYRRFALSRLIVDVPNARSSHHVATPRGAGVIFVLVTVVGWTASAVEAPMHWSYLWPLITSLLAVAIVGFLDDLVGLRPVVRFIVQFSAVCMALFFFPALPEIRFFEWSMSIAPIHFGLLALALVWMLNLYNFMDGIDGIAGVQLITTFVNASVMLWLSESTGLIPLLLISVAAVLGFLMLNWPPAKVFMGDAGSGFLGLAVGLMAVICAVESPVNLWCWLILMSVFIADATFTLVRRIVNHKRFYEAHRSHLYQILARRSGGHLKVSLAVALINTVCLLPLALAVMYWPYYGLAVFSTAQFGLMLVAWSQNAGVDSG